jgi:hypothetical protein
MATDMAGNASRPWFGPAVPQNLRSRLTRAPAPRHQATFEHSLLILNTANTLWFVSFEDAIIIGRCRADVPVLFTPRPYGEVGRHDCILLQGGISLVR